MKRECSLSVPLLFFTGLFYDAISNDIGAEMAYLEANKLNIAQAASIARSAREEEQERDRKEKEKDKAEREKEGEATETSQLDGVLELMVFIRTCYRL